MSSRSSSWIGIIGATLLIALAYSFSEWLFIVTMPSFMSVLSLPEKLLTFVRAASIMVLLSGAVLLPLQLLGLSLRNSRWAAGVLKVSRIVPGLLAGSLLLLLVDNFTYTVLGLGISRTSGTLGRVLYLVFYLILIAVGMRGVSRMEAWPIWEQGRRRRRILLALPAVNAVLLVVLGLVSGSKGDERAHAQNMPNVLLFGVDGVDAAHMSLYGYSRGTTPYLDHISQDVLVAWDNYPNSGHTASSLASIFTGRLPTATKVIFPPDILRGDDVYNHLPGILKREGYTTASFTLRHYADAYDFNLRGGFDQSNERREHQRRTSLLFTAAGQDGGFLLEMMQDRLSSRLLHLVGVTRLGDAFEEVTEGTRLSDPQRLKRLFDFMEDADRPFLAHIHLLTTHGPRFPTRSQFFTDGLEQDEDWIDEFYDEAILYTDAAFRTTLEHMEKLGVLENTVIVLYSDHGSRFSSYHATPLMIRFPRGKHSGKVRGSSQNIDIAPTILDYLELEIPGSMSGVSILSAPRPVGQPLPVFGVHRGQHCIIQDGFWQMDQSRTGPPFYSLDYPSMVICGKVYSIELESQILYIFDAKGSTASCEPPSHEESEAMLLQHLKDNGYDLSSLNPPFERVFQEPEREATGVQ